MTNLLTYILILLFSFTSSVNACYTYKGNTGAGIFGLKNYGNENTNTMSGDEWLEPHSSDDTIREGSIGLISDLHNTMTGNGRGETQVVAGTVATVAIVAALATATVKLVKEIKELASDISFDFNISFNKEESSGQETKNENNSSGNNGDNNGGDKEPDGFCEKHPKLCLKFSKPSKPTSTNQMQNQVQKGKAPKEVKRVDKGKIKGEQDHIHLDDGRAINKDGSFKHNPTGNTNISNAVKDWLNKNGW